MIRVRDTHGDLGLGREVVIRGFESSPSPGPPFGGVHAEVATAGVRQMQEGCPTGPLTFGRGNTVAMRIAIGSDHAGFALKQAVVGHLAERRHEIDDQGTDNDSPVDYPLICAGVGRSVVRGEADLGIVLGGSGQGEAIAANKVRGVRAALCHDELTARLARQHNDANVLSLGGRLLGTTLALAIVDVFLSTSFEGGRHAVRLQQVSAIEVAERDEL